MKKAIFAILVVTLAILAVTCDNAVMSASLSSGQGQGPVVEPEWTTISINIDDPNGRARAMNQALNESSVDFYEVVFSYNNSAITVRDTLEKTDDAFPATWTVTVPAVNYNSSPNTAVLFAGVKGSTNNILIGIGDISAGGNFTTGTSVTFALSAITSSVTTSKSGSSFKITGDSINPNTIPTTTAEGLTVPVYKIVTGTTPAATYTFNIPKAGAVISTAGSVTGAAVASGPTPTHDIGTFAVTDPITGATGTGSVAFDFTITAGSTLGYSKISISVPVYAVNQAYHLTHGKQAVQTWAIEGGINNSTFDLPANMGGAILLQVVDPVSPTVTVTGTSTAPTGWDGTAKTWTVSLDVPLSENIVLTADALGFANDNDVVFTWKTTSVNENATPDAGDADVTTTIATASTSGAPYHETLTIPYDDDFLDSEKTFYVYCIGTESPQTATSTVIEVIVQNGPVFTSAEITPVPPQFGP